jgi:hypothetical protein
LGAGVESILGVYFESTGIGDLMDGHRTYTSRGLILNCARFIVLFLALSNADYSYSSGETKQLNQLLKLFSGHSNSTCLENFEMQAAPLGLTITEIQKWQKKEITVCWASKAQQDKACRGSGLIEIENGPANATNLKKEIQDIIVKEYTLAKTGIHYVGWKSCSENEPYDVMLFTTSYTKPFVLEGGLGEASLGPCSNYKNSEYPERNKPYVVFGFDSRSIRQGLLAQQDLRITALHEFGHLSGLYHEHMNDPDLIEFLNKQSEDQHVVATSVKDDISVMNYEFNLLVQNKGLNFIQQKSNRAVRSESNIVKIKSINENEEEVNISIGLSNGDIHALKCLYVYSASEKKSKCNSNYVP